MFALFTDTDTDLTPKMAKEYGYKLISMPYIINEKEIRPYEDWDVFEEKEFYNTLRSGVLPSTCGLSPETYKDYFRPYLKEGQDILYIHFSKSMSGTFTALDIAINELKEEFPDRRIATADTMGITINSLPTIIEAGEKYKAGATIDELVSFVNEAAPHFATYFYADDLKFFRRSGRVSGFAGFMGNLFGVKPIICMNSEGKMVSVNKGKGRIPTLKIIMSYVKELALDIDKHPVIIGHCDCLDIATILGGMLKAEYGNELNITYVSVNPTAGSHCGPDTLGVSFYAKRRDL